MKRIRSRLVAWSVGFLLFLGVLALIVSLLPQTLPGLSLLGRSYPPSSVILTPSDSILILAPHPDDEVLGCGGIIERALALHIPVHVAFLTNGDSNEWSFMMYNKRPAIMPRQVIEMGSVREDESVAADRVLGASPEDLTFLGYPDFGTMRIFSEHWALSLRSILTRVTSVPYPHALRPGAPYKGEDILQDLMAVLRQTRPNPGFQISHPADQNSDHRALYLFCRVALWDLEKEMHPEILPYLVHMPTWPTPRGYYPEESLLPPTLYENQITWSPIPLTREEITRKHDALLQHRTQMAYSADYLLSFVRRDELFGDFPIVNLPPPSLPSQASPSPEGIEHMTYEERAPVVGLEWRYVRRDGDDLVVGIARVASLAKETEASLEAYGYSPVRPFGKMPKLRIRMGALGCSVSDQGRNLQDTGIRVSREPGLMVVRIPLETLGHPDRVFMNVQTWLGNMPLDSVSWRVLRIESPTPGTPGDFGPSGDNSLDERVDRTVKVLQKPRPNRESNEVHFLTALVANEHFS